MAKPIIPKISSYIIVSSFLTGFSFLVVSYMCFRYIIPGFSICGSACEYWWSWIIDFPRQDACVLICIIRNSLYRPFFLVGFIFIIIAVILVPIRFYLKRER